MFYVNRQQKVYFLNKNLRFIDTVNRKDSDYIKLG